MMNTRNRYRRTDEDIRRDWLDRIAAHPLLVLEHSTVDIERTPTGARRARLHLAMPCRKCGRIRTVTRHHLGDVSLYKNMDCVSCAARGGSKHRRRRMPLSAEYMELEKDRAELCIFAGEAAERTGEIVRPYAESPIAQELVRVLAPMTLSEIGLYFGISRERVRQVQAETTRKIAPHFEHHAAALRPTDHWDRLAELADM